MIKIDGFNYTVNKNGDIQNKNGLTLKPLITNAGYTQYSLWINGERTVMSGHRIVAKAFIPNPNNKPHVNHKNGDKLDNRVENLEWCTREENMKHSYSTLKRKAPWQGKSGSKHNCSKTVYMYDLDGSFLDKFGSVAEASRETDSHHSVICDVCNGKAKTSKGKIFSYNSNFEVHKREIQAFI